MYHRSSFSEDEKSDAAETYQSRVKAVASLPLGSFVFEQRSVRFVERPVDARWFYSDVIPYSVAGFNPLSTRVYYPASSVASRFFRKAAPEKIDMSNFFFFDLFFLIHDYLHIWAVSQAIDHFPESFDSRRTETHCAAVDDLAFVLITSEAVASVGLDFWTLARPDVQSRIASQTSLRTLTTPYRERGPIKLHNSSELTVQDPSFFSWLCEGYCSGNFHGLCIDDLHSDQDLRCWVEREIRQAEKQRVLVHEWLEYLFPGAERTKNTKTAITPGKRSAFVAHLQRELWDIVLGYKNPVVDFDFDLLRSVAVPSRRDFRFFNIRTEENWAELAASAAQLSLKQFSYLAAQFVSLFSYPNDDEHTRRKYDALVEQRDFDGLRNFVSDLTMIEASDTVTERPHLFFPN